MTATEGRPRAYLGIKYHSDNSNRTIIEEITAALDEVGVDCVCVVRDVEDWGRVELEPSELMRRTFELIDSVDVAIIELSEKGVGLGIEAGYAYACRIPVVALHRNGTDMSTTLAGIAHRVLPYAGDRLDVAAQAIRAIVRSD